LNRDLAAALREQWRMHLGLDVRLRLLEGREARAAEIAGDFHMSRSSWVGDYLDPETFLDLFQSASPGNRSGWSDAEYDRLLLAAGQAENSAARFALLAQAESRLLDAAIVIPLLVDANQELVAADLEGFHPNARGHVDWSVLTRRP
jgi:dipeptide transport system substrate-binding protein